MLALCREQRLEHRTKHIALRYFLARELQQRGQLRLAYVASEANTADVFTKALAPCDHQRCCTQLGLLCFALFDWSCDPLFSPTLPMGPAEAAAHATGAMVDANAEADDEADAEARTEEEAEADADAVAPADVAETADSDADAVAEADTDATEGGADAVLFDGENSDDDPWNITSDDDVPLLKQRLRHRLKSKPKRARVVLFDDDSPGEEHQPRFTTADKGKRAFTEAPAKATVRRRTSHKKRKNDGDPGSSTGAAKKKKKKTANKDDIVVNEALGSDDDYVEAVGPIPSFPEKEKPKDPTLHDPNSCPPSPRSKDNKKRRRGWTRFRDRWNLVMRVKTKVGQRLSVECAKDCESFWKFVRINRARHNIDLTRIIYADQTPLFVEMPVERTIEHRGARSVPICTAGYEKTRLTVMLACTASGEKLHPWVWFKLKNVPNCEIPEGIVCQAQDNGWMDESAVQTWLTKEVLPHLNLQRSQNARRAMLVLDSYRGHITQAMLQAYRTHRITPALTKGAEERVLPRYPQEPQGSTRHTPARLKSLPGHNGAPRGEESESPPPGHVTHSPLASPSYPYRQLHASPVWGRAVSPLAGPLSRQGPSTSANPFPELPFSRQRDSVTAHGTAAEDVDLLGQKGDSSHPFPPLLGALGESAEHEQFVTREEFQALRSEMYDMFSQLGLRHGAPASYVGGSAVVPMKGIPPPMSAVDKARVLVLQETNPFPVCGGLNGAGWG
ncbi:unnamed protein product [Closterium sp. NIES-53]